MNTLDGLLFSALQLYCPPDSQSLDSNKTCWVALSGGVDSIRLLHAMAVVRSEFADLSFAAIHVHHGLSEHADDWLEFCEQQCRLLKMPLVVKKVAIDLSSGLGLEGAARKERWQVFDAVVKSGDSLWLGHHQDDQNESLLLNLLRGCGVTGAQGMQRVATRAHYQVYRPWLSQSKADIVESGNALGLEWIEDDSNQSVDIRRNFLRRRIFPELASVWPSYRSSLSRFSEHMQTTELLLTQLAEQDLKHFTDHQALHLKQLNEMNVERRINLLRCWFSKRVNYQPNQKKLANFVQQLEGFSSQTRVEMSWGRWTVKQSGDSIRFVDRKSDGDSVFNYDWPDLSSPLEVSALEVSIHAVPLVDGLRLPSSTEVVTVRSRQGGERACPEYRQKSTRLKVIYQELGVPMEQRNDIPLVFYGEELVAAVGLFIHKRFRVAESESGISFEMDTAF